MYCMLEQSLWDMYPSLGQMFTFSSLLFYFGLPFPNFFSKIWIIVYCYDPCIFNWFIQTLVDKELTITLTRNKVSICVGTFDFERETPSTPVKTGPWWWNHFNFFFCKYVQSNSIIVESIIVENSIIVDNLPSTEDFYYQPRSGWV